MSTKIKIIFVGALPPPLSGQANVNQHVLDALRAADCRLITIDLSPGRLARSPLYHGRRILRVLRGIALVLAHGGRSHRLYLSADSGLGLLYNLLFIAAARITRCSIFLHYHSFSCIDRYSRLMAWLVAMAGGDATHIFLGETMRDFFVRRYDVAGPTLLCSNARFVPPQIAQRGIDDIDERPLKIGLVSNLCAEKGLYDFLALLRLAAQRKLPIRGVLAGPPVLTADAEAIRCAQAELGAYLDFRGPVYGAAKKIFYDDIDIFIFPTRYRVEAQPMVLFEALAHGVPVIAYARGCIAQDIEAPAGYAISTDADFVVEALDQLERWLADPTAFIASRRAATQLSHTLYTRAERGFVALVSTLAEPAAPTAALQVRL